MIKITRRLVAVILAITSIVANAQDVVGKAGTSDPSMMPPEAGFASPETSRRVSIKNASALDGNADANPAFPARTAADAGQQSAPGRRGPEVGTSEFQNSLQTARARSYPYLAPNFSLTLPLPPRLLRSPAPLCLPTTRWELAMN